MYNSHDHLQHGQKTVATSESQQVALNSTKTFWNRTKSNMLIVSNFSCERGGDHITPCCSTPRLKVSMPYDEQYLVCCPFSVVVAHTQSTVYSIALTVASK